jgi:hypothetical protein
VRKTTSRLSGHLQPLNRCVLQLAQGHTADVITGVETLESFLFRRRVGVVELARAVADVSGLGDLCADVVVQVAGQVQDEMSEAVAEGKRLLPELSTGERRGEFVDASGVGGVAGGEHGGKNRVCIRHQVRSGG